ncbi:MAG: phosphate ABC transporter ATP-binding protein [Desulfuromonas sp.]|nr:MAG: phosphate ABC transporter ATP-binding protein [Desulfuromonas sp.]
MEPTVTADKPFCLIADLHVAFHGRPVLKAIDLSLDSGGITVLLGPSGSGKTTLLRALNRLNEDFPGHLRSGRIQLRLAGELQEIHQPEISVTALRRQVGMVFQTPNVLPTSIQRNLLLPLKLVTDLDREEREARIEEVLREVHLWSEVKERLKESATILSGGQQQRLCLARTLALKPHYLLLDEPTASLDFKTSRAIEDLLLELQENYRIIAVSHSLRQARKIAGRIIVMKDGEIVHQLDREGIACPETLPQLLEELF